MKRIDRERGSDKREKVICQCLYASEDSMEFMTKKKKTTLRCAST